MQIESLKDFITACKCGTERCKEFDEGCPRLFASFVVDGNQLHTDIATFQFPQHKLGEVIRELRKHMELPADDMPTPLKAARLPGVEE